MIVSDVDLGRPDGTRTHTTEVARALAREGFAVDLVSRGPDPCLPGVRYWSAGPDDPSRLQRLSAVNGRAALVLLRRRRRARALYVREDWGSLPTVLIARLLGYRVVAEVNDVQYGPGYPYGAAGVRGVVIDRIKRYCGAVMFRASHRAVTVTATIRDLLLRMYSVPADRFVVLPNGVNLDTLERTPRAQALARNGLDPANRYVLFVGAFQPWVDFDMMLGAFADVAAERPWARLILVGDGDRRDEVEELIARHGLNGAVERTGYLGDRADVSAYLSAATVCLAPLHPEHIARIGVSPTKLAEYLGSGRAIVGTAVPGMRETLSESGGGIAVEPRDRAGFAAAIGGLLDDPERADAMGESGRRMAEERLSWQSIAGRIAGLLREGSPR